MTIHEQTKRTLPRFEQTAGQVPWCPRSILKSEGLAVCAMADLHKIDLLIESGVCNGRSTEMWGRYGAERFDVIGLDWKLSPDATKRCTALPVELIEADATSALQEIIREHDDASIGVFIDGPKDMAAVQLAILCSVEAPVQFVGVHDMARLQHGAPHIPRLRMDECRSAWFTDEPWFVELSHHLDADESHLDEEQGTRWTPYCRNERGKPPMPLGSYGYTIGFLAKEAPQ